MATNELIWRAEVVDKASGALQDIDRSATKADKAVAGVGDSSKKTSTSLTSLKAGAGAAAAAFGVLAAGVAKSVQAYSEQERVDRQLQFAIRGVTESQEEANAAFSRAQEIFARNQNETLFGDEDQARALNTLIRVTGDYEQAVGLLPLAMDAATASGKELADATKGIGQAATGDLGPLKEMGLLTQDQIGTLNKVTDSSERWAQALGEIESKVKGARTEIGSTTQTIAQLQNDSGDVEQSFGKLAVVLGEAAVKMATFHDETKEGQSALASYASDVGEFADELAVITSNLSAGDIVAGLVSPVTEVNGELTSSISILGKLEGLVDKAYSKKAVKDFSKEVDETANESIENSRKKVKFLRDEIVESLKPLDDLELAINATGEEVAEYNRKGAEAARKRRQEAEKELEATRSLSELLGEAQHEAARSVELEDRRNNLASLRLGVLLETNAAKRVELEKDLQLTQLQQQLADGELTRMEAVLRRTEIEKQASQQLRELEQSRIDARIEAEKTAAKLAEKRAKEAKAHTRQTISDIQQIAGAAGGIASEMGGAGNTISDIVNLGVGAGSAVAGFATGNIPGGITATIGVVGQAIGLIKKGQDKSKNVTVDFQQPDRSEARRVAVEAYVEAFERVNQGGLDRQVVVDMSGATFIGSDPATAQNISNLIAGTSRLQLGAK